MEYLCCNTLLLCASLGHWDVGMQLLNLKIFSYASSHVLFYICNFHFQVSNHVAAMDDPFVIASLLPPSVMLEAQKLRWTLCATDRCFTNPVLSTFFRSVKVLPVSRGDGIYQKVSILWKHQYGLNFLMLMNRFIHAIHIVKASWIMGAIHKEIEHQASQYFE
jgi:hypothetical protein